MPQAEIQSCPTCNGKDVTAGNACTTCGGSGLVSRTWSGRVTPASSVPSVVQQQHRNDWYQVFSTPRGFMLYSSVGVIILVGTTGLAIVASQERAWNVWVGLVITGLSLAGIGLLVPKRAESSRLIRSPELGALLNALPFPFGIGYAWHRMWPRFFLSLATRCLFFLVGFFVVLAIEFGSDFEQRNVTTVERALIVTFGLGIPALVVLVGVADIYLKIRRRAGCAAAKTPAVKLTSVLMLIPILAFTPVIVSYVFSP